MPAPQGQNPANHTCFTCSHFRGLAGARTECGHPRQGPSHDAPEKGCTRWGYTPDADRDIWTCEDWHVQMSREIPGWTDAPLWRYKAPLSGVDVRDIYEQQYHTWQEARLALGQLAWEIGRERDFKIRIRETLLALAKQPKTPMVTRVHLRRLALRLMEDPGVREEFERRVAADAQTQRDSDKSPARLEPLQRTKRS